MKGLKLLGVLILLIMAGCRLVEPDTEPPAVPVGLTSITGDREVYLCWYPNQEEDLGGYKVYRSLQPYGFYRLIAVVHSPYYVDEGLTNGVTYYYAVSAFDRAGNESDLTPEIVHDTPRPEGRGVILLDYRSYPSSSGFSFALEEPVHYSSNSCDIYYEYDDDYGLHFMNVTDGTDIQDFGYTESLDEINWAPESGWSGLGWVELIEGHSYIVWTRDNHFAKFRVTELGEGFVKFDWAYQVDPGNPELSAELSSDNAEEVRK